MALRCVNGDKRIRRAPLTPLGRDAARAVTHICLAASALNKFVTLCTENCNLSNPGHGPAAECPGKKTSIIAAIRQVVRSIRPYGIWVAHEHIPSKVSAR